MTDDDASSTAVVLTEPARIETWRLHTLMEAGYPLDLAEKLAGRWRGAGQVDLHEAAELVRRGCPPRLAAEILL